MRTSEGFAFCLSIVLLCIAFLLNLVFLLDRDKKINRDIERRQERFRKEQWEQWCNNHPSIPTDYRPKSK